MHLVSVEHGLTSFTERADYIWASGLCEVRHRSDHILDESVAKRVEEERAVFCPEHAGTVLHIIPSDIEMFDQDALAFWMSDEAAKGIVARAAVVPSGITAFRYRIRWMFFKADVPFRVFRNEQVAKGWLIDCWLQHQEAMLNYGVESSWESPSF